MYLRNIERLSAFFKVNTAFRNIQVSYLPEKKGAEQIADASVMCGSRGPPL
jgi:hypothetical protein